MIEYCLFLPAGYFFYYIFSDDGMKGEMDDVNRRYGKELENFKKKKD
tara:strand:- start:1389 stop:1529 length:141 start_codon:yes stop_codon:yes gene_type:complete